MGYREREKERERERERERGWRERESCGAGRIYRGSGRNIEKGVDGQICVRRMNRERKIYGIEDQRYRKAILTA
jgi:hypothetical protein